MVSTAISAGAARTSGRVTNAPHAKGEEKLTPSEARLLTLRTAHLQTSSPISTDRDTPGGGHSHVAAPAGRRRLPIRLVKPNASATFWLVLLTVVSLGALFIDRGGRYAPIASPSSSPFEASAVGSGRIVVPLTHGETSVVRVTIDVAQPDPPGWFWCVESDRALPPAQHQCSSAGVRDPSTGYVVAERVVQMDAASAREATFFVQMYCPGGCRWWAKVAPASAARATAR